MEPSTIEMNGTMQ